MNPPPPRDDETRAILDGIRHVVRVLRTSARAAEARTGVSAAQLFALLRLAQAPKLSLGALADHTLTHPSSVSVVASRLVARGLVARRRARDDARRIELTVTPAGRRVLRRTPVLAQDRLVTAIGTLRPGDRRALARGLRALLASLGVGHRPPAMFFEDGKARDGDR